MRATARAAALALALVLPGVAEAAGPCPVIGALLAENPKRLKGIGALINGAGTFDVTLNGAADAVRGAENCDLSGPAEELDIACDYSYAAGEEAQARRDLEAVIGRLKACLPSPLEAKAPVVWSERQITEAAARNGASYAEYLRDREVLADYGQDYAIGREEEWALSVSVTLVRYRSSGNLRLAVDLERD
ncbi:hypothetical protein [Porphyrobacter sp. AAP82]|uniref:hypothetical protein n=1 Tax=Porphyrobacter sp. AAP82 TaxID=1248917 RepID=UPI000305644B|nr:hypothetical protein [Porphyrobacter sp. AAP82]